MFKSLESLFCNEEKEFKIINFDKTDFYKKENLNFLLDGVYVALEYNDSFKRKIENFKYLHNKELHKKFLPYLKKLFDLYLKNRVKKEDVFIVGVPMTFGRYFARGYNQTYLLAENFNKDLEFIKLFKKIKNTKHQVGLSKKQRQINVLNSFTIKKKYLNLVKGKDFIIVDDIISTGSTANELTKILKKNGARKVYGLFLATGY
ncbi:MAG: phosphoribosyltransferase family protein [Candidatus Gracilibacteria bacterium]|nr:phosphoribosyltransferase family protein [Candidatus Gracilibacteria bacterium]MDD3119900.1 phosphoribosyltransferase family protein [Candidatus Gracilibacteria bacterium]MDD4530071.1 phosphoribosyltransferase family protein [Candidatus Gracilibacteria bacterium]